MFNREQTKTEENFWTQRYVQKNTGWDIGKPSRPLKLYIDQLQNKSLKILIPGAGNSYEAEHLFNNGFKNVYVLDISKPPLVALKKRVTDFPENQIIQDNFFLHKGSYDLVLEQTFFCSFPPTKENRISYAKKMNDLIKPKGKLAGLWFNFPLTNDMEKRPFGGSKKEYLTYLSPYFEVKYFDECHNSIPERLGKELFGIFQKQ